MYYSNEGKDGGMEIQRWGGVKWHKINVRKFEV